MAASAPPPTPPQRRRRRMRDTLTQTQTQKECAFLERVSPVKYTIKQGFVPGMRVPGTFYVNDALKGLLFEELQASVQRGQV